MKDWMRTGLSCPDPAMPAIALTAPNSRTAFWSFILTRFLPQISLRNLRKLDCYANRFPPTDQVRGHASLENALAATPHRRHQRHEDDDVGREHPTLTLNARDREVLHPPNPRVQAKLAADADTNLTGWNLRAGTLLSSTGYCGASICWRPLKCLRFRQPRPSPTFSPSTIATWPTGRSPSSTNAAIRSWKRTASARLWISRPKSCRCTRPRQHSGARWR